MQDVNEKKLIEVTEAAWRRLKLEAAVTDRPQFEIASDAILTQLGPDHAGADTTPAPDSDEDQQS